MNANIKLEALNPSAETISRRMEREYFHSLPKAKQQAYLKAHVANQQRGIRKMTPKRLEQIFARSA